MANLEKILKIQITTNCAFVSKALTLIESKCCKSEDLTVLKLFWRLKNPDPATCNHKDFLHWKSVHIGDAVVV